MKTKTDKSDCGCAATVFLDDQRGAVVVQEWSCEDPEVVAWGRRQSPAELPARFGQIVRLGILAVDSIAPRASVEDVDRKFSSMQAEFKHIIDSTFGEEGRIPRILERYLGNKGALAEALEAYLGNRGELSERLHTALGQDGDLERRLRAFVGPQGSLPALVDEYFGKDGKARALLEGSFGEHGAMRDALDEFFGAKGELRREFDRVFGEKGELAWRILNPSNAESPLGKLKQDLEGLLDERKPESPFAGLHRKLDEVKKMMAEIMGKTAESEKGTAKGRSFQERVLSALGRFCKGPDDELHDVGDDAGPLGKQGDHVVVLNDGNSHGGPRVVIEVRDRPVTLSGKGSIHRNMEEARQNRSAAYAIAVIAEEHWPNGLEQLQLAQPSRTIFVRMDDADPSCHALEAAYKMARILALHDCRPGGRLVTAAEVAEHIARAGRALEIVRSIKSNLTKATNDVTASLEQLHDEVEAALDELRVKLSTTQVAQ